MDTNSGLTVHLIGPLRVVGADGRDYTPRGRKAQGVIALLATTPGHKRARAWLQDKLWSDRAPEQGAGSLRQTLTDIRHALGPYAACFVTDRIMAAFDPKRVSVVTTPSQDELGGSTDAVLLEGLDIADPEFEDWLRDQRSHFETVMEQYWEQRSSVQATPNPPRKLLTSAPKLRLVLEPHRGTGIPRDTVLVDSLTDMIAKTISEISAVDVIDRRRTLPANGTAASAARPEAGLTLEAGLTADSSGMTWRLLLSDIIDRRVVGSVTGRYQNDSALSVDNPAVLRELNQIADLALANLSPANGVDQEGLTATLLCRQAIQHLRKLSKADLEIADRLFARAFEIAPLGIYLAWRAFLRMYVLAERFHHCRQTTIDEAVDFMQRALELDPHNSYVASFAAHVHTVARRSYVAAYELAQRSIQLNRANPLGWGCLGMSEINLGKQAAGLDHTMFARDIAGASPLRFHLDTMACIAGSVNGNFERAIWFGEASHALAPSFRPPLRYLSVLYLLEGKEQQSLVAVEKLKVLEPTFSYDVLRDKAYPIASMRQTNFLERLPVRQM